MINWEEILHHYEIDGQVIGTVKGPLITQVKFRPQVGTKFKKITSSLEDIRREAGVSSLRISNACEDNCIGFEIPNDHFETVDLMNILDSDAFKDASGELLLNIGVKIDGTPVFADLAKMPHLLAAGATGSGKSVGLNAFILSLIAKHSPDELKFILIDPKRIEFSIYNDQAYLYMPVITDNDQAADALNLLVEEMNRRYTLFEETRVKNLKEYNQSVTNKLPYLVAVIDEFSDLVLTNKAVEKQIQLLAQKARAAGIHMILATQRPSVDVVTGSIKANFPSRISFKTASGFDSKTILDTSGAEDLVGRGDALFLAADGTLTRVHGAYVSNADIDRVLLPYRQKIKPLVFSKNNLTDQSAPKAGKKKNTFFLLAWVVALWNYIGKRNQKKIIQFIFNLVVGATKKR